MEGKLYQTPRSYNGDKFVKSLKSSSHLVNQKAWKIGLLK